MATYILVHGAWHGGWCWEKISPLLAAAGHTVYAPDLPGHGADKTPISRINLKSYVQCIEKILTSLSEPVILVGHSLAGIIISQVAENNASKIKKLIYIAAFLPKNGDSLFSLAQQQPPTSFSKLMKAVPAENAFYFPVEQARGFAYHCCDEETIIAAQKRLCVEPLLPSATSVKLSAEKFGLIPKIYIECEEDQAVLLSSQQRMHCETPCQVFSLKTDHSPFYSTPKQLAALLLNQAE